MVTKTKLTEEVLRIKDPVGVVAQEKVFIQKEMAEANRDGVVIASGGGKDSSLAICFSAAAVGADKVLVLYLPTEESKTIHGEHARWVAQWLGVRLETIDITPVLRTMGVWDILPEMNTGIFEAKAEAEREIGGDAVIFRARSTGQDLVGRGNAFAGSQHRLRAVYLSMFADLENRLMVGCANYSEFRLGSSILFGCDELAEVMPVRPFYRTQVMQLLRSFGVPREISDKLSDPDVMLGVESIDQMFGPSLENDLILYGLDHGFSREELEEQFGSDAVTRVTSLVNGAGKFKRGLPHIPVINF